ncbi:hypothetical protein LOD99_14528 [Oopsacas minuta]|uniref:AAA+ ATPase domain-containing protein n=1 Tax=Oopsacas minuta TaxID=111878 RepID=A0AAV7KG01_9METZ|nr:hypothetical protein LOD99_14528 [Oopsacas minuta]
MSWIPGISSISNWLTSDNSSPVTTVTQNLQPRVDPVPSNPIASSTQSLQTIDPTGFERAANAIKQINMSPHASKVLEVTVEQEKSRRKEMDLQQEQLRINLLHEKSKLFQQDQDAKKQYQLQEAEQKQRLLQYQDQLERKRSLDLLQEQKKVNSDNLKAQEESVLRQEAYRKNTLEYESKLNLGSELEKIKAKMLAKGDIQRNNHDLTLEEIRLKEEERRSTVLKSISEINGNIAGGVVNILTDFSKLGAFVGSISLLALGIYTAKNATIFTRSFLESIIGKPKLVRDTSRISLLNPIRIFPQMARRLLTRPQFVMDGIFFNPGLANRLQDVALATYYTRTNNGNFRNLYLYGPPGTGKTLYAKSLAWNSGLDYALFTGGDIVPLGINSVTEIHKLFKWANTSRKGVLIFIDEADAFLKNRSTESMSENLRSSLNAFLYLTGDTSKRYMLVLSSNQPYQFDSAILDRLDDIIEVGLPDNEERVKMLKYYFTKFLYSKIRSNKFGWGKISLPIIDYDIKFQDISLRIDGFSGREITKLVNAWQAKAYSSQNRSLTENEMDECIRLMLQQHTQKHNWAR